MVLKIDGYDIVPYIAYGGLKFSREDVDGPDAGRDLTGDLRRARIATKRRIDVTTRPLFAPELSKILSLIMPEWVSVEYYDPQQGVVWTRTMYSNNINVSYQHMYRNGKELYAGFTFPLVER